MSEPGRLPAAAYLRLSLRNLLRNPRRSFLTFVGTLFGIAALTFLGALNDGWLREMKDNFILTLTGHVQIHAKGFEASQNLRDRITDPSAVILYAEQNPDVQGWTQRIRTSGLVSAGTNSAGVQILAVDPEQETWVTRMHEAVSAGAWLRPGGDKDLLLGETVARNLGAQIGDRLVLMAQRPGGEMVSEVFYLRGILVSGAPQVDRMLALIPLAMAQTWLGTAGAVTDIVLRAESHDRSATIQQQLQAELSDDAFEVMGWQDLDPMVQQWLRFSDSYGLVVIFVVIALVLAEILNTMLMALHERVRELGIMEALGTRKHQLFWMVLLEAVILIGAGALAGYLLGAGIVAYFARDGLDLSAFANAFKFFYMNPVIRPVLTVDSSLRILASTLVASLVAGMYPAWKATRIELQDALRRN